MSVNPKVLCATIILAAGVSVAHADTVIVNVFNFDFSSNAPGQVILDPTINVGDTVQWVWRSGFHSVTSVAGGLESFNSGNFASPHTFSHTFTQLGNFNYFCNIHGFDAGNGAAGGMSGRITVVPTPGPAAAIALAVAAGMSRRRRR